jgi:hypothetical protein
MKTQGNTALWYPVLFFTSQACSCMPQCGLTEWNTVRDYAFFVQIESIMGKSYRLSARYFK